MTPEELAILGIDAPTILYVYSWGFGSVILMWSLGFAVGSAITLIKKI